ncbi:MAG: OFA family MFS transporter [Gemmatimonadales bacterium]
MSDSSAVSAAGSAAMASGAVEATRGRWLLAGAAVLVQLALGAVYAWSVFVNPFIAQMGWTRTQTTLPFTVVIGTIFIGTLTGGRIQDRIGPRPVVLAGGILYSIGVMLASLVDGPDELWLLILTYGVMGGIGLGAAYIVPIAMLVKWFPDRRGLITGIAVAGFGAGALITAPVANRLIDPADVSGVFLQLGLAYLVTVVIGGSLFRNPPAGYAVPGYQPPPKAPGSVDAFTVAQALRTPQWYRLTAILALNVTAGIALLSQAAPAAIALADMSAAAAASIVGILGIFNGAGRVLWGWASDHIGRMQAFVAMFVVQLACFALLPLIGTSTIVFFVLAALVYLCYGGGFGTMPATAAEFFGAKNAGGIYGAMIVGWSIGGVVGPLAIAALVDATGGFTVPFFIIAALTAVSVLLPLTTRKPT